jgi:chorismate mutase
MEALKPYRKRIDELDNRIIDLLSERTDIVREVGAFKTRENIPVILQDRIEEVLDRVALMAEEKNLDVQLIRDIYASIIDYSCGIEASIRENIGAEE